MGVDCPLAAVGCIAGDEYAYTTFKDFTVEVSKMKAQNKNVFITFFFYLHYCPYFYHLPSI